MKKPLNILVATVVGCFLVTSAQAGPGKPVKRILTPLVVTVDATSDPLVVDVVGDCDSEYANVEYNFSVSGAYTLPDDLTEYPVSGSGELENTIPLTKSLGDNPATIDIVETDYCLNTTGSTGFLADDVAAAIQALVDSLLPEGATWVGWSEGCSFIEAKAWTTSNSVKDSHPTQVDLCVE